MEAKLAAFRAKKLADKKKEEQKQKVWSWITLEGLRNRFRLADPVISSNRQEAADDLVDEEEDAARPWTTLDWIILAVKLLIWFTFQVIFAKLEFGAIFFSTSCFAVIYLYGFGKARQRDSDNLSAYSVFNPNCETLQGTLTGEQFDQEIRHKLPAVAR